MLDIYTLSLTCQHDVHPTIIQSIIAIESAGNPNALAIVGQSHVKQPRTSQAATRMMNALEARDLNYSVGLMQINKHNFTRFGLNSTNAVSPCANISVGARIIYDCYQRAKHTFPQYSYSAWRRFAASCYFSGNFHTGFHYPKQSIHYVTRFERAYQHQLTVYPTDK